MAYKENSSFSTIRIGDININRREDGNLSLPKYWTSLDGQICAEGDDLFEVLKQTF